MYLKTSCLIKVHFPTKVTHNHWVVEEKKNKAIYAIPPEGIFMLVLCIKPVTKKDLLSRVATLSIISEENLQVILKYLLEKKIIFYTNNLQKIENFCQELIAWKDKGWNLAAHYHFFTCEAPYLDYSEGKKAIDKVNNTLSNFHAREPDIERCKEYTTYLGKKKLPSMKSILKIYDVSGKN